MRILRLKPIFPIESGFIGPSTFPIDPNGPTIPTVTTRRFVAQIDRSGPRPQEA